MNPTRRQDIFDTEAERLFLAMALHDPTAAFVAAIVPGVSDTYLLGRPDFTDAAHKALWDAIECSWHAGFEGSAYLVALEGLRGHPDVERVGGSAWLAELAREPRSIPMEAAAARIIRASFARDRYARSQNQ